MTKYLRSKTLWIGAVVVLTGALQALATLPLDSETAGLVVSALGVLAMVNRFFTTLPISEK